MKAKKFNVIRRWVFVALCFPFLAVAGVDGGNGGGGFKSDDGTPMTFHEAGFYINPKEEKIEDVPQLKRLIDFFDSFTAMSDQARAKIIAAIKPRGKRKYYKASKGEVSDEEIHRLIKEYNEKIVSRGSFKDQASQYSILGDDGQLTIYAVTIKKSKATYLLPDFYKLSATGQMAILLHESYWLMKSENVSYQEVVNVEMLFEDYLKHPQDDKKKVLFIESIGTPSDILRAVIDYDLKNNTMEGLVSDGYVALVDLLGEKWKSCYDKYFSDCYELITDNLSHLMDIYPNSLFLEHIYSKARDYDMGLLTGLRPEGRTVRMQPIWGPRRPLQAFVGPEHILSVAKPITKCNIVDVMDTENLELVIDLKSLHPTRALLPIVHQVENVSKDIQECLPLRLGIRDWPLKP